MSALVRPGSSPARTLGRVVLGGALAFAGTSHLTFAREEFRAQVPPWVPIDTDTTVLASGVVEISLGLALIGGRRQQQVGNAAAAFFTAIFPGNIAQLTEHRDAFGLDTDAKRVARLFGQPALVALALWSTRGAEA